MICSATAGIMFVIIGIAATSEHHVKSRRSLVWLAQLAIVGLVLGLGPLASRIIATALLLVLFFCFVGQTALLLINQPAHRDIAEIEKQFNLSSQCFFKALLCFCRECCVRDFADFFGKLARDFAHVIELLRIALAKRAHEIMDAQLDPRGERQGLVHAQGKNADHLRTYRCEPADEQHNLQLKPVAVLLEDRRVVQRARVRSPFRQRF